MQLKTVTFNIRCSYMGDGINAFVHRAGLIWDTLKKESPDIIGFQEVIPDIYKLLKALLAEDYEIVGQGRENDYGGEGLYVAVKKSTCTIMSSKSYWMSETPCIPGSGISNQCCNRIFNSVVVKHNILNKVFRIYNLHHDCTWDENIRYKEATIVLNKLAEEEALNPLPLIIMGDFNTRPCEKPIKAYNEFSAIKLKDLTEHITHTYHEYGKYTEDFKIDYIFVSEYFADKIVEVTPWTRCEHGIYLSDHYPIAAVFEV